MSTDWFIFLLIVYPLPIPENPPDHWKKSLYKVAKVLEVNQLQFNTNPESEVNGDFEYAINFYRIRFRDICNCPPTSMSTIFPDFTTVGKKTNDLCRHNEEVKAWILIYLHRKKELTEYQNYIERSYHVWWYTYCAVHTHNTPYTKRMALQYLKEELGDEDFYGAKLPNPIIP